MDTWPTIDGAPLDGTEILVYDPKYGMVVASFSDPVFDDSIFPGCKAWRSTVGDIVLNPSHYLPLPERPRYCKRTQQEIDSIVEMVRDAWTPSKE